MFVILFIQQQHWYNPTAGTPPTEPTADIPPTTAVTSRLNISVDG